MIGPLTGLWRDTWWLWVGFAAFVIGLSVFLGSYFLLLLPTLPVTYAYFAYARYDAEGNEKPDIE